MRGKNERKRRDAEAERRRGSLIPQKDTMIGRIASGKIKQDTPSVVCK
jgi:hypothetical protein